MIFSWRTWPLKILFFYFFQTNDHFLITPWFATFCQICASFYWTWPSPPTLGPSSSSRTEMKSNVMVQCLQCMGSRAVHIEINHSLDRFFYSSPKESHCQVGKYQNSFFRQWQQFYWLWKWIEKGIWRNGKSENPVIYLRSRRRQDKVVRNLSAASHMGGFGRDKSGMLMQFSCNFLKHMENHLTKSHF